MTEEIYEKLFYIPYWIPSPDMPELVLRYKLGDVTLRYIGDFAYLNEVFSFFIFDVFANNLSWDFILFIEVFYFGDTWIWQESKVKEHPFGIGVVGRFIF